MLRLISALAVPREAFPNASTSSRSPCGPVDVGGSPIASPAVVIVERHPLNALAS
jgi:hypothetical protein